MTERILVKSFENHIEGYGFTTDLFCLTRWGCTPEEIKAAVADPYAELETEFTPNGKLYEVYGLKIRRGTLNVYAIKSIRQD